MTATDAGGVCHFFGYLVHTSRKKINCEYCAEIFVNQKNGCDDIDIEEETCLPKCHGYNQLLDRGGLLYPSNDCLQLTMVALQVFEDIANMVLEE